MASCQKLGVILEKKMVQKLKFDKSGFLNQYSEIKKRKEKKKERVCCFLTVQFWRYLMARHYVNSQNEM